MIVKIRELWSTERYVGQFGGQMSLHLTQQVRWHAHLHGLHFLRGSRALLDDARKRLRCLNPQFPYVVMMSQQMGYIEVIQVRVGGQLEGAQMWQRIKATILKIVQTEIGYIQHFQILIDAIEAVVVQRGNGVTRQHQPT